MSIEYMETGYKTHVDRGFETASTHLKAAGVDLDIGGDREQHSRRMVDHVLELESERVPSVTAEMFAEAIAVADAVREAQGRGPVTSFRARDYWEVLKELIDGVSER
jgi:hypothetical protein